MGHIFLKAERALYNGNTDTNVNSSDLAQGPAQLPQGPDGGRVARRWRAVGTAGGEACQTPGVSPALGDFETALQPSQRSSINSQRQIGPCVRSEPGGELWRPPGTHCCSSPAALGFQRKEWQSETRKSSGFFLTINLTLNCVATHSSPGTAIGNFKNKCNNQLVIYNSSQASKLTAAKNPCLLLEGAGSGPSLLPGRAPTRLASGQVLLN